MPVCRECMYYSPKSAEMGECQINGAVPPERDIGRCPSRTFRVRVDEKGKSGGRRR